MLKKFIYMCKIQFDFIIVMLLLLLVVIMLPGCQFPGLSDSANIEVQYFHPNHLGTIKMITNSSGNKVAEYRYLPYGELIASASSGTDLSKYKYTAQEEDASTGLDYYKARFYDPAIGRFITADNLVDDSTDTQGWNRYMYVKGNPVNSSDPSGHLASIFHDITSPDTADVDYDEESQGTAAEYTVAHGMRGVKSDGTYQSSEEVDAAVKEYIKSSDMFSALHAAQDYSSLNHNGQKWNGKGVEDVFKFNSDSAKIVDHAYKDCNPSLGTMGVAILNSGIVLIDKTFGAKMGLINPGKFSKTIQFEMKYGSYIEYALLGPEVMLGSFSIGMGDMATRFGLSKIGIRFNPIQTITSAPKAVENFSKEMKRNIIQEFFRRLFRW